MRSIIINFGAGFKGSSLLEVLEKLWVEWAVVSEQPYQSRSEDVMDRRQQLLITSASLNSGDGGSMEKFVKNTQLDVELVELIEMEVR